MCRFRSQTGECRGHDQGRQGEMDGQKPSLGLRVVEGDGQRDLKIGQAAKINRGMRSGRINNPGRSGQSRGTKWFPGSVGSDPGGDAKSFRILANGHLFQHSKQNLGGKLLCASEEILVRASANKKE